MENSEEVQRACTDLCMLMTCECLKEGLRTEGLQVSGLKKDLARCLGLRMTQLIKPPTSPTLKQMKYILWLWRVKDMQGRHNLKYYK